MKTKRPKPDFVIDKTQRRWVWPFVITPVECFGIALILLFTGFAFYQTISRPGAVGATLGPKAPPPVSSDLGVSGSELPGALPTVVHMAPGWSVETDCCPCPVHEVAP